MKPEVENWSRRWLRHTECKENEAGDGELEPQVAAMVVHDSQRRG
jgi:hypothetical protein